MFADVTAQLSDTDMVLDETREVEHRTGDGQLQREDVVLSGLPLKDLLPQGYEFGQWPFGIVIR
ncbi:hypothetical protein EDD90_4259 [Streptomyces sp. Ag109_O5-1]|nr:hypothetical protein EDD90_4259 [Streptomyces sp. Ag109_O5-1]